MLEKTESAITNGQSRDTEEEKDKKTHTHTENQNEEQLEPHQKIGDELICSQRVSSSCFL